MDHRATLFGRAMASVPTTLDRSSLRRLTTRFWSSYVSTSWMPTGRIPIFREAITNNSGRPVHVRMAHLFCELFYRARISGVVERNQLALPLNLIQLGETLGMAIATVNRTLQQLRTTGSADFRDGVLTINNWDKLVQIGEFDPRYLHLKKVPAL